MTTPKAIDLDRLNELATGIAVSVQEIVAMLSTEVSLISVDDMMPVQWFSKETYVTGDQLRAARLKGKIRAERRGTRWFYSRADAHRLFPDRWAYRRVEAKPDLNAVKTG